MAKNLMCPAHKDNRKYRDEYTRIFRGEDIEYPEEKRRAHDEYLLRKRG